MSTASVAEPVAAPSKQTITLEILSTFRGHDIGVYVEDTSDLEKRAKLAEKVEKLLKDGFEVFLVDQDRITHRIKEYDTKTNEWIVFATRVESPPEAPAEPRRRGKKQATQRVPADGTKTTAVAKSAGG